MQPGERFLRLPQVLDRVGLTERTVYSLMTEGKFPRQRRISHKVAVWVESEIEKWMTAIVEGSA